jgi:hypothetical protein
MLRMGLGGVMNQLGYGIILGMMLAPLSVYQASAATLKPFAMKDGRIVISISGEIAEGDTDSFKAAVKIANDAGKLVTSIRLNSPGGDLLEGVKLADAVRFAKISTNVGKGTTCASACFLIFAAGETKFANYTAQIGVHGASDQAGQETAQSGAATVSMARVAKELGVPPAIIGRMVVTPPSEMVWLTPFDLQSMGTTMVGKPLQVATGVPPAVTTPPRQTQPSDPINLQPSARASAPPSWDAFVAAAVKISASQNNGKAVSGRVCQPENKTCNNAVIYYSDGTEVMVKVTRDLNEKIILREVCTFNTPGDIRLCLDWDAGTKHRDMKNASGEWFKVADE